MTRSDSPETPPLAPLPRRFPIVGVGASAGGLAPTVALLRELGAEPGVGLVVIHHLDPNHESGLAEILSRATRMPVSLAQDGVPVEPNHVYVVPPNAGLLLRQGALVLVPRQEEGGRHLPIDRFFESLALDRDELAVGVVLSGSGFDGTAGAKAIKKEGGFVLAQDGSAEYGAMPEGAIATGCVDVIAPPAGLARELRRLAELAPSVLAAPRPASEEREFHQILALAQKATGIDFASYKPTTLRRRMQRRLVLHGLSELAAYVELLKREPGELGALSEELLVHVTGFFREPEAFEALRTEVFPRLCEGRRRNTPIRVWVPGCSTGEEVYSLAICLLEYLEGAGLSLPIRVFGTDLSPTIVERARAGRYGESVARELSEARLHRFFVEDEGGYRIRRDVRDLCVFARHDVTQDPPFSAMDLVSCRNLLIYLGPELQDRVISLFHYSLRESGYLALGGAETVRAFAGFAPVDGKNKIYVRTTAAPRLGFDFTAARRPLASSFAGSDGPSPLRAPGTRTGPSDVHREADRLVLAEFAPPGLVVSHDLAIVQFRGQIGPFLEPAPGVATLDLLRMAREELRLPLRRAIDRARSTQAPVREAGIGVEIGGQRRSVALEVVPFSVHLAQERYFLVLFEDTTLVDGAPRGAPPEAPRAEGEPAPEDAVRRELASTRQYLESVIEQLEAANEELKAANEEIVSSNEELRSTNEELQSAKEELQATNEELLTVNDELSDRNAEATRLGDDLTNVLHSVEIPILLVGRDLRLRRFTPAAARTFGLVPSDLGRTASELPALTSVAPSLPRLLREVVEQLAPSEQTIQDRSERWLQLLLRPYVTLDGRIDGAVLSARDVDAETRAIERLTAARAYAESIVDTVREGLVVLDSEARVLTANKAFQKAFQLTPAELEGRRLDELGRPVLALPALRELVRELAPGQTVEGFRLDLVEPGGALRAVMVNARHVEGRSLVLLALEDITETERARLATDRAERVFRDALAGATEGVVLVDAKGHIQFVNRAAAAIFGYAAEELTSLSMDVLLPDAQRETHAGQRRAYLAGTLEVAMGRGRVLYGRRKDGSPVPIEVVLNRATPGSVGDEGEGPVVLAFVTDVTQRVEAEEKLRSYQERLQRMAFDAALTEEKERRRIALALHDGVGQILALAEIKLTSARAELAGPARAAVDAAVELIEGAIADQRGMIFELSPPVLYDLGLGDALAWLAEDIETHHGMPVELVDDDGKTPLDETTKAIVFRAVRELLMNVLKHAKATSARVHLAHGPGQLEVRVEDAGIGFVPHSLNERSSAGFGLLSIREQITRLGGALQIDSAPAQGTRIQLRVPLAATPTPSSAPPASQGDT
jgi:two-component system CheB/CheR fusion protein